MVVGLSLPVGSRADAANQRIVATSRREGRSLNCQRKSRRAKHWRPLAGGTRCNRQLARPTGDAFGDGPMQHWFEKISLRTLLATVLVTLAIPVSAADVVVVSSPKFDAALDPWLKDRRAQGLDVAIVRPLRSAPRQLAAIEVHLDDQTRCIVLVGDAPVYRQPTGDDEIPSFELPTTVTGKFNSTQTFVTDLPYAGDRIGDVAVGRLPVRSAEELTVIVAKILASDRSTDFGPWRSRVELVGGVGGFGMMIDSAIESTARTIVTSSLPESTRPGVLYGSPKHRFYPATSSFRGAVVDRYRSGCRFWIYAGHGQVTALDHVPPRTVANPAGGDPVLDGASAQELASDQSTIALMLACFNGAIDAPPRCMAESLITSPKGPVAVIAGTRVTMPYGNSKLSLALINSVYQAKAATLGQAWSAAINEMSQSESTPSTAGVAMFLDAIAAMMHGDQSIANAERIEHASLFQLIGDPTMKLHPPSDVHVAAEVSEAGTIDWTVQSPLGGTVWVTLDVPLGGTPIQPDDPNQITVWQRSMSVNSDAEFGGSIPCQTLRSDWYTLRVHVAGDDGWAAGSAKVFVP